MKIPINDIEIIEQTKIFLSFIELKIKLPNGYDKNKTNVKFNKNKVWIRNMLSISTKLKKFIIFIAELSYFTF